MESIAAPTKKRHGVKRQIFCEGSLGLGRVSFWYSRTCPSDIGPELMWPSRLCPLEPAPEGRSWRVAVISLWALPLSCPQSVISLWSALASPKSAPSLHPPKGSSISLPALITSRRTLLLDRKGSPRGTIVFNTSDQTTALWAISVLEWYYHKLKQSLSWKIRMLKEQLKMKLIGRHVLTGKCTS